MFKEIYKQARLNAEYNQVSSAVDDSTKLVQEYEDYIRERQASLSSVQKHKSKLSKERKAVTASVDQQINEEFRSVRSPLCGVYSGGKEG